MKKILKSAAAILAAAVCGSAFAACDNGKDSSKETPGGSSSAAHVHTYATEWSSDETYHWHAATCGHEGETKDKAAHTFGANGKCTACGCEKPVDYTVTEAEWAEALDFDGLDNYTVVISAPDDEGHRSSMTEKHAGNNVFTQQYDAKINSDGTIVEEERFDSYYYHLTGGKNEYGNYYCEMYSQINGIWKKKNSFYLADDTGIKTAMTSVPFASCSFDEKDKCYKAENIKILLEVFEVEVEVASVSIRFENSATAARFASVVEVEVASVSIRFENKKVVEIIMDMGNSEPSGIRRMTFSDYGTTAVTLPALD